MSDEKQLEDETKIPEEELDNVSGGATAIEYGLPPPEPPP